MNIAHLSEKYELNELEKQIIDYMQKHINELKSIGIRQMAKDNYTSTSTIYKLCNKFGFSGYSDMIYHLTSTKDMSVPSYSQYKEYKEQFTQILKSKSKYIVVLGLGFSAPIAEYIQQRLTMLGYPTLCAVHMEMLGQWFHQDTILVIISYSGKTHRLIDIVETASINHIPIISFVGNQESPIYENSTLPILIGHYDSFSHDLYQTNTFYGETIIAFEKLLFD